MSNTGRSPTGTQQDVEKILQLRARITQRLNVRRRVGFASRLAVASLDGFFDHPANIHSVCHSAVFVFSGVPNWFFNSLLVGKI
ncbi:MAG: hypothetical protein ACXW34_10160 [Nitrospira sp.]